MAAVPGRRELAHARDPRLADEVVPVALAHVEEGARPVEQVEDARVVGGHVDDDLALRGAGRRTRRAPGATGAGTWSIVSSWSADGRHRHHDDLLLVQDDGTALAVGQEREERRPGRSSTPRPASRPACDSAAAGRKTRPAQDADRRRRGPRPPAGGAGPGTRDCPTRRARLARSSLLPQRRLSGSRRRPAQRGPPRPTCRASPRSRTTSRGRRPRAARAAAAAPSGRGPGSPGRGSRSRASAARSSASGLLELARRRPRARRGAARGRRAPPSAASRSS